MNGLVTWAVVVFVLFLLGQIPLGAAAQYTAQGPAAWIRVGAVRLRVYPLPKRKKKADRPAKEKKPPRPAVKPEKPAPPEQGADTKEKLGGAIELARQLLPLVLEAAGQFRRKLRVDLLELELTVGAPDPADAAARYGWANAALGAFWHPLTRAFRVRDGRAHVALDFDAQGVTLYGKAALSIKLGQILWLGLYFGGKTLSRLIQIRNRHKAERGKRKAV